MTRPFTIFLGRQCNNRCVFCPLGEEAGENEALLPLRVAADLQRGAAAGQRSVAFAGGEPTLHAGLSGWIGTARSLGFSTAIVQTNGRRLAYRAYADALVAAGLTAVDVSLHGPLPAVHDYHTRAPGSFLETVRGLRNLGTQPALLGVTTVVTRSNFRNLEAMVELLAALHVDAWHLALPFEAARLAARVIPALPLVEAPLQRAVDRAEAEGIRTLVSGRRGASDDEMVEPFVGIGARAPYQEP